VTPDATSSNDMFELRLYQWSPLGPVLTTLAIGAVLWGLFWLNVWLAEDLSAFVTRPIGQNLIWISFILTLILCAALGVANFDDHASKREAATLEKEFGLVVPVRRKVTPGLRRATLVGLTAGLGFLAFLIWTNTGTDVLAFARTVGLWFMPITPLLWISLARGVHGSVASTREMTHLIKTELQIDLYRHHELAIFGRIAMRGAFIWLIFVGIILISLRGAQSAAFAQPTLLIAMAIASFNFISTMQPVRKKIRAAKDAELASIREQLAQARAAMEKGGDGASIPALIALEARVEHIREWPLDLPTAARLPLYLLIPVVPWAAGIYAERILEQLLGGG
jgi:hypothetical protein